MTETNPTPTKPIPLTDVHSQRYWDAAADRQLLIQRCGACGAYQFYPRQHCTTCFAPDPEWWPAGGGGTLHTFSVVYASANPEFAEDCPYVLGIVELDEGVRVTTRILAAAEELRCDARVQIVWPEDTRPSESGPALPTFALQDGS